jgi:hypothetical protein
MGLESLRAMLDTLEGLQAEQVVIKENIGKLKMHIQLEMEAQDATLFEDDAWKVEIKPKFDYRDESLIALREFYSPEDLEALMNKPRPRTFHKGKIKKELRKGGDIKRIIEGAMEELPPELTIKPKGG